jgi:hypothetical protein
MANRGQLGKLAARALATRALELRELGGRWAA